MDISSTRPALQDKASGSVIYSGSPSTKQDASVPSHKAPSVCTDQASRARSTRVASGRTDQYSYKDALTRERRIATAPKIPHVCQLRLQTKGFHLETLRLPVRTGEIIFKLVLQTVREFLPLITSPWASTHLHGINATESFLTILLG